MDETISFCSFYMCNLQKMILEIIGYLYTNQSFEMYALKNCGFDINSDKTGFAFPLVYRLYLGQCTI